MTCRSKAETLSEWLTDHAGEVVQIGTTEGSGFLYAGKAGRYTLDAMRNAYGEEYSGAIVSEVRRSFYGGYLVFIKGTRHGSAELPRELMRTFPEAPIEKYIEFADVLMGHVAREYKNALLSVALGHPDSCAETNIITGEAFFRSESFTIISRGKDGEDVIWLIKEQVRKEVEEHERRRKERAGKWLY